MRRRVGARVVGALVATLAPILAHLPAARAQDIIQYTVRAGDSCRSIAQRVYGDGDAYPRIHELNPELGPTPHHLAPGTVLRLPAARAPAELARVHRRVERRLPDGASFAPASAGQPLPRGSQVRTHEASSAEIEFEDHAEVQVRERTLVIIYGGARRMASRAISRAELESGALRSRLGELAGRRPLEVETPSSRASLDGDAVVSVDDDGSSRVANHSRRAATVEANGARVELPAGTGTVVRRGEAPSAPRPLLAAPRWLADTEGPVIGFVGRGATLRGGFEPVRGAARYRVEVSRQPDGRELLTTLELGARASRFEAEGLPEGTVYVSIATLDDAGLEGRRSPWRAFTVRLARLVEPGGGATTIDRAIPEVWPGTWLVAPRGMTCALGDGEGTGILTLREPGRAPVRCADRSGTPTAVPVDVVDVVVRTTQGSLQRDRATEVRIELAAPHVPPARVLVVRPPDGFTVEGVRTEGSSLIALVWAPPDAPDEAALAVDVAAGTERITLGVLTLPVRAPIGSGASEEPTTSSPDTPRPPSRPVHAGLGDVLWPSAIGLTDERRGGFGGWLLTTLIDTGDEPQLRVGAGARAQLPETPMRIMFASQLDVLARAALVDRRGDADLYASLGAELWDDGELGLAIDAGVWIPTRSEPESLGRVRVAPTASLSWTPLPELSFRTRQGALIDATENGARLWASATGVDLRPLEWLAIGLELDASVGRFDDRDGAALGLGAGLEAHADAFEVSLSARFGLTDEGRALFGGWLVGSSVRLWVE
ncbi:MAG: FecR domain-containing protein [Sandaracinaceae bacterium]